MFILGRLCCTSNISRKENFYLEAGFVGVLAFYLGLDTGNILSKFAISIKHNWPSVPRTNSHKSDVLNLVMKY
jgi:hypothetical protein